MTLILAVGVISAGVVSLMALRLHQRRDAARMGWMSEQWLAEHRAEHSG